MSLARLRTTRIFRWGSLFLLAAFVFASTPHDFIHEFTGHKDTVDVYLGHTAVSIVHIHCEFLRILLSPTLPASAAAVEMPAVQRLVWQQPVFVPPHLATAVYRQHRGPPCTDHPLWII